AGALSWSHGIAAGRGAALGRVSRRGAARAAHLRSRRAHRGVGAGAARRAALRRAFGARLVAAAGVLPRRRMVHADGAAADRHSVLPGASAVEGARIAAGAGG